MDPSSIDAVFVDEREVAACAGSLAPPPPGPERRARLLDLVGCLDLTSLRGDETEAEVRALCARALQPVDGVAVQVAAVCILPPFVSVAADALRGTAVRVACAAGDFPTARAPRAARLDEIRRAVDEGAHEIDAVVQRAPIRARDWAAVYEEVRALARASGGAALKAILGTGDLGLNDVARVSRVALEAGTAFLKTSTGKDPVNATLTAGIVMARELRAYHERTGARAGLKPAGGVRSADEALRWAALVERELGRDGRTPGRFRIGASALLDDVRRELA